MGVHFPGSKKLLNSVDWIYLEQDRNKCVADVDTVIKFQFFAEFIY